MSSSHSSFAANQDLNELVNTLNAIVWEGDPHTFKFTFVSQRAEEILGYPVERWLAEPDFFWKKVVHPEDQEWVLNFCIEATKAGQDHEFEYRVIAADGRTVWLQDRVNFVRDAADQLYQVRGLMVDITERKQLEEALQQQRERKHLLLGRLIPQFQQSLQLESIFNITVTEVRQSFQADRAVIVRSESDGDTRSARHALRAYRTIVAESVETGWSSLVGMGVSELLPLEHLDSGAITNIQRASFPEEVVDWLEQQQIKAVLSASIWQGEQRWLLMVQQCCQPRQWQSFETDLLQEIAEQLRITIEYVQLYQQLEAKNRELEQLAGLDSLTQVANRRRFDEYLNREWQRNARERIPLALILCDIDNFKSFNDTYGHPAGDKCLLQIAEFIAGALRRPADLVARYGGEEFALILPNTEALGATQVAEKIRSQVKALEISQATQASLHVTLSFGVASRVPSPAFSPATIIAAADRALYQAKHQGRDRIVQASFPDSV